MVIVSFILFLLALLCFAGAALVSYRMPTDYPRGLTLVALGLFFWVLEAFIHVAQNM